MLRKEVLKDFVTLSSKQRAKNSERFFKTGEGEYGQDDQFVGVTVPGIRKLCKKYLNRISLEDLDFFITSKIHEHRLFALLCLTYLYEEQDTGRESGVKISKKEIYDYYVKNLEWVNSWDLVDASAHKIVGEYLKERDRSFLYDLVRSKSIWNQRVAIVSTMVFIKGKDFKDILEFNKLLLDSEHDLIHKALGWMLREVGKEDVDVLKVFLDKYGSRISRTTLRYSIEKFNENERIKYLSK